MVRVDLWNFSSSVQLDSSQVSAANEWDVELNTISEIPYLEANMYYFVYHINTIAFNWRENSTFSTNENKRIDNPRTKLVKCVGDKAQYEKKKALNHYKTTVGVIFNIQNCQLLTFSLPIEIFQPHS